MEEKPKNTIRKIIAVVMLFIVGAVFLYFGFQNEEDIVFSSVEDNAVHYKVFLKENNFFETPYLEEGGTYITSLIDRIDVNFHYQEALTKRTSGNISYYVRATISADKTEDSEVSYWSKDYLITEPSTLDFSDSEEISFDVSASVNYQEFNDILESFRKEYPVVSDGKIKIALIVDNTIYADEFSSPLASSSELNLSLPLLKRAIDAQINVNTGEKVHRFKTTVNKDGAIYPIMLIVGFGLIVTSSVIAVLMAVRMNKWKKAAFIHYDER